MSYRLVGLLDNNTFIKTEKGLLYNVPVNRIFILF